MKPLDQWRREGKFFEANGNRLAFWSTINPAEEKPWLLLIHGFPTSSWDWSGIWSALEKYFNLVAMDMLGFGLSDKPSNVRYSIMHQADFYEALLERQG